MKRNHIVIHMDGGIIQQVLAAEPIDYTIVDYDVEGADPEDIAEIPQPTGDSLEVRPGFGRTEEAYVASNSAQIIHPDRLDEILAAVESRGTCKCNGEDCTERVAHDAPYHSSPCGTYCEDCMRTHAVDCEVCNKEFDIYQNDKEFDIYQNEED